MDYTEGGFPGSNPRDITFFAEAQKFKGYEFEAADASLKLLIARSTEQARTFFKLISYRVMIEYNDGELCAEVKVEVNREIVHTVAECVGPVGALDKALRLALDGAFPQLRRMELRDYKVRILESGLGANSRTRVLIESSDGDAIWGTVGVSDNMIDASWLSMRRGKRCVIPSTSC